MAKNSEIIGEYIITIDDNDSVSVSRIYKSTRQALAEIAEANGIEVLKSWTTQHLGRLLLTRFCDGAKEGTIGEYSIEREGNNRINVIRTYAKGSVFGVLQEIADSIGFTDSAKEKGWSTQNFGRQLVKYYQTTNKD